MAQASTVSALSLELALPTCPKPKAESVFLVIKTWNHQIRLPVDGRSPVLF